MLKCKKFISKFNLVNGKMEWILQDDDYDMKSEIRTSGYADMLNDKDRNVKYYNSLKQVIQKMKNEKIKTHVLDIGCGSGILSMMALRLGADKVTACESFEPMFECAKKIMKKNKIFSDKIDIINCNSVDLKIGLNMTERANILVSEIFDTELIGEGVLPTFSHALKNLLTENAVVIPFKAKIFIQVLDNEFLRHHSWLNESRYFPVLPPSYYLCSGYSSVFDIQSSALSDIENSLVDQPLLVKEIEFAKVNNTFSDVISCSVPYLGQQTSFSYLMWWELVMVNGNSDCISTAPKWTYKNTKEYNWRDHWLQGIYSTRIAPENWGRSRTLDFNVIHDTFSFSVTMQNTIAKSFCTCGLHSHLPHNRLYQLNSTEYAEQIDLVIRLASKRSIKSAIIISDFSGFTLAFLHTGMTTNSIIDIDSIRKVMQELITLNDPKSNEHQVSILEDFSAVECTSIAIVADPFFVCATLPWDCVHFWYAADYVRQQQRLLSTVECWLCPSRMRIKGILVEFDQLDKVHRPVNQVLGFDLGPFDELIHGKVDPIIGFREIDFDAKFLWEYKSRARSDVWELMTVDMTKSIEHCVNISPEIIGIHRIDSIDWKHVNGLVLWTEWELDQDIWVDYSFQSISQSCGTISWGPSCKQAVHFLHISSGQNGHFEIRSVFNIADSHFKFYLNTE